MKKIRMFLAALGILSLAGCTNPASGDSEMDSFITDLMSRMSLHQKIGQLNLPTGGDMVTGSVQSTDLANLIRNDEIGGFFNVRDVEKIHELQRIAVEETELKIPLLIGADIIHGFETIFPIPLALSCSWDTVAVETAARIAAEESSINGINWTFSPMVDICRDPRWGRIAEGNGEDPYLGGVMAAAYVRGYQGDLRGKNNILACVKHFALYGASEAGRDYNTVDMSRVRMYNEYLPPYKAAVEAGVGSVMSSFNVIDGTPATAHKWLLTDLLRDQWGFKGFVVTDYESIHEMKFHGVADLKEAAARALAAGTDMDMVSEGFLKTLEASVADGSVSEDIIDRACRRILEAKYKLGLFSDPYKNCNPEKAAEVTYSAEYRAEARRIAAETFVLLKNESNLLPLQKKGSKIALIGPMADAGGNMCGCWTPTCKPENHKSLLQAMREAAGNVSQILYAPGSNLYYDPKLHETAAGWRKIEYRADKNLLSQALAVARQADVIVAALGESAEMSGESVSRTDLEMPDAQKDLLEALAATGKPVVLLLFSGRPVILNWESENIPAILNVWQGGSEAADAIADVVFGEVNPSGKLTTTFPRSVGQIPLYYNHMNTGRPIAGNDYFVQYRSNYLDQSNEPLYPFGYGLSYTSFSYGDLALSSDTLPHGGTITASVTVSNTGDRDGIEIVQLYIHDKMASITRPVKELKKYQRITLKKGESRNVEFILSDNDLKFYNADLDYVFEPGEFEIMIGPDSKNISTLSFTAE